MSQTNASKKPVPAPADAAHNNLVGRYAPISWLPYLRMARIDRPIGWWLLLLPCWWSSALAASNVEASPTYSHILLFLVGAVVMRGAGSVWNDIVDRNLDGKVERTRNRPLPSGQISVQSAVVFACALCVVGLLVLLSFNTFTIVLGFLSLVPVAIYPFMKRITDYPQGVLGLAFSWGALMGWGALTGSLGLAPVLLYMGTVLWVVGYDTIYALQDIEDDSIVGIRSTARLFGARAPVLVAGCYFGTVAFFAFALVLTEASLPAWMGLVAFAAHLTWQVNSVDVDDSEKALRVFKSNRDAGLLLFVGLLIDCFV